MADTPTGTNVVPFGRARKAENALSRDTQTLVSYFAAIKSGHRRQLLVQIAHRFLALENVERGMSDEAIAMAHAVANEKLLEALQEVMHGEAER